MYKLQAFCVLVLTLLAFSQESPVPSKNIYLRAAQQDLRSLKTMDEVVKGKNNFLVPTGVQTNCTLNALDCFSLILDGLHSRFQHVRTVSNTISNVLKNVEEVMRMDSKETKIRKLCSSTECHIPMQKRNAVQALDDFIKLLQLMYQGQ